MQSIALMGADGAGKSTIIRQLTGILPVPVIQIYMGVNLDSSNLVLPTTLLWHKIKHMSGNRSDVGGPPDPAKVKARPKKPLKRIAWELKSVFRMANLMAEEWYRQLVAWYYQVRGYIVIFDRHFFFDYYAHHITNTLDQSLGNRIHGKMLKNIFPRPSFVIFLDAPPEVLFARKGEGTIELLEKRRQEYLQIKDMVNNFVIVDATQPVDVVTKQVSDLIMEIYRSEKESSRAISEPGTK